MGNIKMKMEFQRKKCKKEFNRELLTQMNEHPVVMEKIAATIDKVELVGNKFCALKGAKCCKCLFVLFTVIMTLTVGIAIVGGGKHHHGRWNHHGGQGMRGHGPNRGPQHDGLKAGHPH